MRAAHYRWSLVRIQINAAKVELKRIFKLLIRSTSSWNMYSRMQVRLEKQTLLPMGTCACIDVWMQIKIYGTLAIYFKCFRAIKQIVVDDNGLWWNIGTTSLNLLVAYYICWRVWFMCKLTMWIDGIWKRMSIKNLLLWSTISMSEYLAPCRMKQITYISIPLLFTLCMLFIAMSID